MLAGVHVRLDEELLRAQLGGAVQVHGAHRLVGTQRECSGHARIEADLGDVLGAEDVGLDRLERVVLADRHVFQGGRVDDHIGALDGAAQPIPIAHVADEEAKPRVVELPLHVGLLQLVAAEDADGRGIPLLERGTREMLAEGAGAPRQQDGPALEMIHSRSSFSARMPPG